MRAYLRSIEDKIAQAGGAPIVHTGKGVTSRLRAAFDEGKNLLVLVDVPKGGNRGGFAVDFLGRPTYFASGLLNIAIQMQRPIVPYSIGLDFNTGQRQLEILPPLDASDVQQAMAELARYFDTLVRAQPPGWHFWHLHPNLLSRDFSKPLAQ
jgi:lauroyl/myristoyl acyltransferase